MSSLGFLFSFMTLKCFIVNYYFINTCVKFNCYIVMGKDVSPFIMTLLVRYFYDDVRYDV